MIRLARHYIEEPPNEEPEHGWCPKCDRALVDAHECRCGWQDEPQEVRESADVQREIEDHFKRGCECVGFCRFAGEGWGLP